MNEQQLYVDYFNSGGLHQGPVANEMFRSGGLDANAFRPFYENGRIFKNIYKGGPRDKLSSYQAVPVPAYDDLQVNATLRRDEWKQLDQVLLAIRDFRLGGIMDLIDAGLTFNLGNAMGTTVLEWHDVSDALTALMTMDGVTRGVNDRPEYQHNYLPIPIIHADFEINLRELETSRRMGNPLDTTLVERGGRRVNEQLESLLFTNTTYSFGGGTIYSYLSHPSRNLVTLSENWDASGKTGSEILADVLAMKQAALDARFYGPWKLYIPHNYETKMDSDFDATSPSQGTTIRERIMKVEQITGVKVIDTLPDDNVVMVQMTSDVVRLVQGMPLQTVRWATDGNFITKYKVMRIAVPQIRADQAGHCGIVHLS